MTRHSTNFSNEAPNWQVYTGAAAHYQATRPDYPTAATDWILQQLPQSTGSRLAVDVGCGTGIFTRRIAEALDEVDEIVGIEPNDDMRTKAIQASTRFAHVNFIVGSSESLPVANGAATLVTAASAAHWFDLPRFYGEAARILSVGGALCIVQNKRRWRDSMFLEAYEAFHETFIPGYRRGTFPDRFGGFIEEPFFRDLSGHAQFHGPSQSSWEWNRRLTVSDFRSLSLSTSHTRRAIENAGESVVMKALGNLLDRFADPTGVLDVPYVTEATLAKRRG